MSALRRQLEPALQRAWYQGGALSTFLRPLGVLFCALTSFRRRAYVGGRLRAERMRVPVVVAGNLAVGGTGKTPFVIWLAQALRSRGLQAGIITRGYGGSSRLWPREVHAESDPDEVGDEAVLLARRTGCTVMAGPDRVAAARALLGLDAVDVVLSDDGLQHYRLARDLEVIMIDGGRGLGNGRCLPAGPLREPPARLHTAGLRIVKDGDPAVFADALGMQTRVTDAVPLRGGEPWPLSAFAGRPVHAVAGLGNPGSFFAGLKRAGLDVIEHALPDHARPTRADIEFSDGLPVLMTEKDMVKCVHLGTDRHWYVPLEVDFDEQAAERVLAAVTGCIERAGQDSAGARDSGG